jgi:hypothetical protein
LWQGDVDVESSGPHRSGEFHSVTQEVADLIIDEE